MIDPAIAVELRKRGHDVQAIQEHTDLLGSADAVVLEQATSTGRALVTDNVRHFIVLHEMVLRQQRPHAGLLFVNGKRYPRTKAAIGLWVRGLERTLKALGTASFEGQYRWLD